MAPLSPQSRRAVLLLHEGHGAAHIDLLLERDDGPLVTFRAPVSVTLLLGDGVAAAFEAERLPDHRRVYLEYEGPVSSNRGTVRRVATLLLHGFVESPASLAFDVSSNPASPSPSRSVAHWTAGLDSRGLWRFDGRGRLE